MVEKIDPVVWPTEVIVAGLLEAPAAHRHAVITGDVASVSCRPCESAATAAILARDCPSPSVRSSIQVKLWDLESGAKATVGSSDTKVAWSVAVSAQVRSPTFF